MNVVCFVSLGVACFLSYGVVGVRSFVIFVLSVMHVVLGVLLWVVCVFRHVNYDHGYVVKLSLDPGMS